METPCQDNYPVLLETGPILIDCESFFLLLIYDSFLVQQGTILANFRASKYLSMNCISWRTIEASREILTGPLHLEPNRVV